jgi:hypothetical protein
MISSSVSIHAIILILGIIVMIYLDQLLKERNDYSAHLALIEKGGLKHLHSGVVDRTMEIAQELRNRIAVLDEKIARLQKVSVRP